MGESGLNHWVLSCNKNSRGGQNTCFALQFWELNQCYEEVKVCTWAHATYWELFLWLLLPLGKYSSPWQFTANIHSEPSIWTEKVLFNTLCIWWFPTFTGEVLVWVLPKKKKVIVFLLFTLHVYGFILSLITMACIWVLALRIFYCFRNLTLHKHLISLIYYQCCATTD